MKQILPVFSFPITIVCLDDDTLFLKSLTHKLNKALGSSIKSLQAFTNAQECLDTLKNYTPPVDTKLFFQQAVDNAIQFNFITLAQLHETIDLIEEIGILIIDQDMPGINGIELCRQLKDLPIQKILLTGRVELADPMNAFNNGVINCYINKESPDLISELLFHIDRFSKKYFMEKTMPLLNHLETSSLLPLSDPLFIDFFMKFCEKNHIIAYYLIDKNGSFLMKDRQGQITYFVVYTQKNLTEFLDVYDDDEFSDIRKEIITDGKVPFFGAQVDPLQIDTTLWPNHLYAWNILNGRELYYWAVVTDKNQ